MKIPAVFNTLLAASFAAAVCTSCTDTNTDKDHDGVVDSIDQCPDTPPLRKGNPNSKYAVLFTAQELSTETISVAVDETGCALDSDKDGIADYRDYCPDNSPLEISAGVASNGCPLQSDADGTPDYRDKCPDTAAGIKTDRFGCPQ